MRVIRVFPRKTNATPDNDLVRVNCAPTLFDAADEVQNLQRISHLPPLGQNGSEAAQVSAGGKILSMASDLAKAQAK